jgi:dienelactone hydrolase
MPTSPERFLSQSHAYRPTHGADGVLYVASDLAGVAQTYRLSGPDRFPVRMAPSQHRTIPVAHTGRGLLVRTDRGNDECWQLGVIGEDGELETLTRDAKAIHRGVVPAPDGRHAGLAINPGGRADWALGVFDVDTGDVELRIDRGGYWSWLSWSHDGARAAVTEQEGILANKVFILEPDGALTPVLPDARYVADVVWCGERLFALSPLDGEFVGLAELDPADPTRPVRWTIREDHDVELAVPDPAGRRLAVVLNTGAYDELRILDPDAGAATPLPAPGRGVLHVDNACAAAEQVTWGENGASLLIAWESATVPGDVWELPIDGGEPTRWTRAGGDPVSTPTASPSGDPGTREPVDVVVTSFDGLDVPCLHYRVDGAPRPTVVYIHGGPEGQSRASYTPAIAMWNAAGYDVLAPNVRGSTGYGVRYHSLDDRERRWDAVRDACAVGRWLRDAGHATELVAMGGSYGGFMTLAVLVEDPALWTAGVDIVGIADWHTFFRNTSGWRRSMRAFEYGEPNGPDGEFLARFSPLRRAAEIRAHLLVIHGRNDPRVPLSEAEQIHAAVPTSELMVFDDEGHGISRHANRERAYGRALAFVTERLARPPAAATPSSPA